MRGQRQRSGCLFSYVSIEHRIPTSHPLRQIRKLADFPTVSRLLGASSWVSADRPVEKLLMAGEKC